MIETVTQIRHEDWHGEVGNCLATPRFSHKIGTLFGRDVVKAIRVEYLHGVKVFTVYWKKFL
jgi:hypothetical protein